jgi:hypothetical protein
MKAAMTCINYVYMSVVSKYGQQLANCSCNQAAVQCLETAYEELSKYSTYLDKAKQHFKVFCSKNPRADLSESIRGYVRSPLFLLLFKLQRNN